MSTKGFIDYCRSDPGSAIVFQTIGSFIAFLIMVTSSSTRGSVTFFSIVSFVSFFYALVLLIMVLLNLRNSMTSVPWNVIEVVCSISFVAAFFISSTIIAANAFGDAHAGACAVFGFFLMISHLKSVRYSIRQYKTGEQHNENQNPPEYDQTGNNQTPDNTGYTPPDPSPFLAEGKAGYQAFPESRPVIP